MKKPNEAEPDFDLNMDADFDLGGSAFGFEDEQAEPMPESFEDATKEEVSALLQSFKSKRDAEEARKDELLNTDFWFAVYFASQKQRDAFLIALNLFEQLDDQYLAGDLLAEKLGIKIPKEEIKVPKAFRSIKDVDDLVMDI